MDNLSRIATTDNRLLRRLTRDYRQRGADALSTLSRWASVRRGEEKHIFPYQENADIMLNSSLFYEISVLRPFAEKILREVPDTVPEYDEARRMLKFLSTSSPSRPTRSRPRRSCANSSAAAVFNIRRGKFCASVSFILPLCVRATAQLYEPCGAYAISLPEGGPGWDQNCKRRHRRRERLAGMKDKCEKYIQTT